LMKGRMNGRKEGGDHYFGTLQGKHVWFMAFHPWWLPNLAVLAKKETNIEIRSYGNSDLAKTWVPPREALKRPSGAI